MYEGHWQLYRRPFDIDEASSFYPARTHQGAMLKLRYLVDQAKGIAALVGEHGVGKTFLTRVFEAEASPELAGPFVRLMVPQLSPEGMLAYLAARLGAPCPSLQPDHVVLERLEGALAEHAAAGACPVLVIDDAHLLEIEHLELIRLLLNLNEAGTARFSVLLCGRPELLGRLETVAGLDQRVVVRAALEPLEEDEVGPYLVHRLNSAGGTGAEFNPGAVRRIWQLSQGCPRRINQLADLALLVGYADSLPTIGPVEVDAAAEELYSIVVPAAA